MANMLGFTPMKPLDALARRVALEWRRANGKLASFTGIATRALEAFDYDLTNTQLDEALSRWFLETSDLPDQVNLHNTFGQPPVTVFNNGRFVVDLYFWLTFDTSIHSHGFRGAFRVLHGKSLHEVFTVKTSRAIAPDVELVQLGAPQASLLKPGDVRSIQPGQDLTHGVIHLEIPTVTLCVKTINEPRIAQWKYFPNGLAIQMRHLEPRLIKKIYYFQYLAGQDAEHASSYLDQVLRSLDRSTCMNLYGAIASGAYDLSEAAALHFAARLRKLHGKSEWFQRYEAVDQLHLQDLHFEDCDSPLQRLIAHFINGGHDLRTVRSLIGPLSKHDIAAAVSALMECEGIFGLELSMEDRTSIKDLLANPGRKIPGHLRALGQIRKMRDFLKMFRGVS
jgi:hypothetical protein